jgi:hypothetical protein
VKVVGGVGVEAMLITVRGQRSLGIVKGNCHIDGWPVREPHLEPPTFRPLRIPHERTFEMVSDHTNYSFSL